MNINNKLLLPLPVYGIHVPKILREKENIYFNCLFKVLITCY